MKLSDFDYTLPPDLIALRPARPRRSARLLISTAAGLEDSSVDRLASALRPGDVLVFNDTKVIPSRLFGQRLRGDAPPVEMEATLIDRLSGDEWRALARPGKRLAVGDDVAFGAGLKAEITAKEARGAIRLRFSESGPALDRAIAEAGVMPLPPYIAARRPADEQDRDDYQTLFAERPGAVAAPTASLHFDEALMGMLAAAGVTHETVTLHVGAGTFLPVTTDDVEEHEMHAETGALSEEAAERLNAARAEGRRIIAVGTTSLRLLESAADGAGRLSAWRGDTALFIRPGVKVRAVDALMTNFHLPKSTLLMLVAALIGKARVDAAYSHAVRERYRFYSYGDACLLWP